MADGKMPILSGHGIQLLPLSDQYRDDLYQAAQDGRIWEHVPTQAYGAHFDHWFHSALKHRDEGRQLPFVVKLENDQKVVGSTRYYEIHPEHKRLAIGYTWYLPALWGSFVNPACKYLLLQYAFETLHMNRVEFFTDLRNERSRAAIQKIGAVEEGILRQHMVLADGFVRDTVVYSILQSEWPDVKTRLEDRLKKLAG